MVPIIAGVFGAWFFCATWPLSGWAIGAVLLWLFWQVYVARPYK